MSIQFQGGEFRADEDDVAEWDSVHNGRTADLQNIFSEATENWGTIQSEWDTFIARCYGESSRRGSI